MTRTTVATASTNTLHCGGMAIDIHKAFSS